MNHSPDSSIQLRGVRVHNLKNLDLDIPLNKLVVLSGVSGSGKSSLAFDTLFAEGQRRYIESFSIASRRHLERLERPDVDLVAHVPVAIAIRSDQSRRQQSDARSTVATIADLLDGLRLLFSRVGQIICPGCGRTIRAQSAMDVVQAITGLPDGTRCQLVFAVLDRSESDPIASWLARGFARGIWNGTSHDLSTKPAWPESGEVWVVADRFVASKVTKERILESAEAAFREGSGRCLLLIASDASSANDANNAKTPIREGEAHPSSLETALLLIDGRKWRMERFSRRLECTDCKRDFLPLEPRLFSHLSSGACLNCDGTGRGSNGSVCPACQGTRFRDESRAVKVVNRSIADLCQMTPAAALKFIHESGDLLRPDERQQTELIRADIAQRLTAVCELGLDYLTLDRPTESLSGGEFRRLMLAAVIGSGITSTMVVVDEPSAGLTVAELPRVVAALRRVQTRRNSVICVDHSPLVVSAADYVIELGPGAGPLGGNIVFQGPPNQDVPASEESSDETDVIPVLKSDRVGTNSLTLANVNHHNLHGFHVEFPLRQLCVVTGPSGSGKTSLVTQVLFPAICDRLGLPCNLANRGTCDLTGGDELVDVVLIDQSPLTRSRRSNPATWLEVFDEIRQTFAATADAKQKGFTSQQFSFNSSSGGRCRSCLGTGLLKHDMQFLPDVTLSCPECGGTRYRPEILEVKYRGRSIADVLAMSVSEAASFFRSQPRLQSRFLMLKQIGLDYLVLGQPSETLSGGEAQRLKLAARLAAPSNGGCLIICDEPTTGLHPTDVRRLNTCFRELLANGHSLVLADNSPELLAAADDVVELIMR